MQGRLQKNPLDIQVQVSKRKAFEIVQKLSALAESFILLRSKATWIRLGDGNTKNFYSVIKQRRLIQAMTQLTDENLTVQTDPDKVAYIFLKYYQKLLGETGGPRVK